MGLVRGLGYLFVLNSLLTLDKILMLDLTGWRFRIDPRERMELAPHLQAGRLLPRDGVPPIAESLPEPIPRVRHAEL